MTAVILHSQVALLLGDNLLPLTMQKIWKDEYVDVLSLLFRNVDKMYNAKEEEQRFFENQDAWSIMSRKATSPTTLCSSHGA